MKTFLKILISVLTLITIQAGTFFIDPTENAISHNNYGLFYFKLEDYPAAIQEFKIAIALSPNSASSASFYNNLGLVYLRINRYDWAINCFDTSISMCPNFLEYYVNLVKAYKGRKSLKFLSNKYRNQLSKNNSDYIPWLVLGLIDKEQNNKKAALNCFKEFKKLGPDELLGKAVENVIINMR